MAKRLALGWALILTAAAVAFTGDVAQFVNLGFSPDSRYFMFGQYGILEKNSTPWADAYIVDVPANAYAPRGTKQFTSARPAEPGTSALGALLIALCDNPAPQEAVPHRPSPLGTASLRAGGRRARGGHHWSFAISLTGRTYKIALQQSLDPKAGVVRSSFRLAISVTEKDGKLRAIRRRQSRHQPHGREKLSHQADHPGTGRQLPGVSHPEGRAGLARRQRPLHGGNRPRKLGHSHGGRRGGRRPALVLDTCPWRP